MPVIRRGYYSLPVYFRANVYHPDRTLHAVIVWSPVLLTQHLWVRPAYYRLLFRRLLCRPLFEFWNPAVVLSFTFGRTSYDPLFSYYRWLYRDRDWSRRKSHDRYRLLSSQP